MKHPEISHKPQKERLDITVIGAGPVGLTLALGLARSGLAVTVLEQDYELSEFAKAPAVWPRTQEILAHFGVITNVLEHAETLTQVSLWDADRNQPLVSFPLQELASETLYPHLALLPQSQLEKILYEKLHSYSHAKVMFGAKFLSLSQSDSQVSVTYELGGQTMIHEAARRIAMLNT